VSKEYGKKIEDEKQRDMNLSTNVRYIGYDMNSFSVFDNIFKM